MNLARAGRLDLGRAILCELRAQGVLRSRRKNGVAQNSRQKHTTANKEAATK